MKSPVFNDKGLDSSSFAPFQLQNCLDTKWQDIRLWFADWEWLERKLGTDGLDGYDFNGYGIQGLVQAAMFSANLETRPDEVHFNSEGDTCNIHFKSMDDAVRAANLASEMINDPAVLARMVRVARAQGFED